MSERVWISLVLTVAILTAGSLSAQAPDYVILRDLFGGSSSDFAQNAQYFVKGTAGQVVVGEMSNTSYIVRSGGADDSVISDIKTDVEYDLDRTDGLPENFRLDQNFPNPFNPTTSISFALPSRSDVTLRLFNVLGQKIATLVNGSLSGGEYVITLDGSNLASGVYFYRMRAGGFSEAKKLVVLK